MALNTCCIWRLGMFFALGAGASVALATEHATFDQVRETAVGLSVVSKDVRAICKAALAIQTESHGNDREYQAATDLHHECDMTVDVVAASRTLLYIYGSLTCASDRDKVANIVREEFDGYREELNPVIDLANETAAYAHTPATALNASKLTDAIRRLQQLLMFSP